MSPSDPAAREERLSLRLLLVIVVLSATAPLSVDFYLPVFPQATEGLRTEPSMIQLTLTGFLVGLGLGQILWGPISDRFGRRRPLIVSTSIACVAACVCIVAPTVEVLIGARFLQAVSGAAGMVLARAAIADTFRGFAAARTFALIQSIQSLAPILAPIVGGALSGFVSWRGILAIVAGVTFVQLFGVLATFPESLPPERRKPKVSYLDLVQLMRRPVTLGYIGTTALTYGVLMAYISSSSFVYQRVIGVEGWVYGVGFAVNALALLLAGTITHRLAKRRVHPARTMWRAIPLILVAALALLLVVLSPLPAGWLVVPLWFVVLGCGLTLNNSAALIAESIRDMAGSGSGLQGGLMFLAGGIISPLGGIAGDDTALPMAVTMVVAVCLAALVFSFARRAARRHPQYDAAFREPVQA